MTALLPAGFAERTAAFVTSVLIIGAILSISDAQSFVNYYKLEVESDVYGEHKTNSSNITISDNLIGATVTLSCASTNGSLTEYAVLEWTDGDVPIRESMANRELEKGENSLSLVIRNFTVESYGEYHCRCVNDYSRVPRFSSPRRHLTFDEVANNSYADRCFTGSNMVNLLPNGRTAEEAIVKYNVTDVGNFHKLPCESGNWIIWKSNSAPTYANHQHTLNITIRKSADQTKAVCFNSNNSLEKIFYVSIRGYDQLLPNFIRPSNGTQEVVLDLNSTDALILCLFQFKNFHNGIRVSRNGRELRNIQESDGIPIFSHPRDPLTMSFLFTLPMTSIAPNKNIAREWYNSTFSCSVGGMKWEEDVETTFTLARPDTAQEETSPTTTTVALMSPSASATTTATSWLPSTATSSPWLLPTDALSLPTALPSLHPSTIIPSPSPSTTGLFTPTMPNLFSSTPPSLSSTSSLSSSIAPPEPLPSPPPEPSPSPPPGTDSNTIILVSAGIGSLLVFSILLLCIVYICLKKCSCLANRRSMAGLTAKQLFLEFGITENGSQPARPSATNLLLYSKSFANCIYELEEKQWLFPYEQLEMGEELGSGAFGVVKKAEAHNVRPDGSSITVAVKMLKENGSDEEEKDLISELKVLQHVGAHPNIVSFLGATINQGELHIIVEFCGKGSLLHYLRSKRGDREDPLTPKSLIAMAHQVSQGMKYLASKKCIHRDLAARNVLVTEDLVLKVADFGLARKVYDSVYRPSGGRVPIKWMSPETILDREYTTQSDVWSFGILLWEIMSLGRSPYPGKSPEEVIKCIKRDYRMPAPERCPQSCYSLMLKCWEQVPGDRPSFAELCNLTEELGTQLEALEFRNYHILEERTLSCSGDSSSTLTVRGSELCCYCSAEVDGETNYCRCSRPSLLEDEGDKCVYENTCAVQVGGAIGPDSPRSSRKHKSRLQALKGVGSMPAVSNGDQVVKLLNGTTPLFDSHQSSSMPYLPIVWASTDYLPLMSSSSHPCNAAVSSEPDGNTLLSKDSATSQSHTHNKGEADGSHYDKLLTKSSSKMTASHYDKLLSKSSSKMAASKHQPHPDQRHSLHDVGSYCKKLDSTSNKSQHQTHCLNSSQMLQDRDCTSGSQHRTRAKSLDGVDMDSPLVITNHLSPAHELWSGEREETHPCPVRPHMSTAATEKLKVEPQHSNTSDDSGVDFLNSFPDEQQMEKPPSYAPKMKIELRESNASNDSGVDTPMSFPEGQEDGQPSEDPSNCDPIVKKMKVKPRQSTASDDSGMDTPTPSEKPSSCAEKMKVKPRQSTASNDSGMDTPTPSSSCVLVTEKMKVEHQQSNLSNDSGIVTLASDITSLLELWSQKSSLSSDSCLLKN